MVSILPFAAWRPSASEAGTFACPPYDVLTREEATELAPNHRFLRVTRPEVGLAPEISEDDLQAHSLARSELERFKAEGVLAQDPRPQLYAYRETMGDAVQTGIVACVLVADYESGVIKRHERTLVAKQKNRTEHFKATGAHTEPVFLTYRRRAQIDELVAAATQGEPEVRVSDGAGVIHELWPIAAPEPIVAAFEAVEAFYIADGHHRSASAAAAAGAGDEGFMAVIFPDSDLTVMSYNRAVHTLGDLSPRDLLDKLGESFAVTKMEDPDQWTPRERGSFGMWLAGEWYLLEYKGEPSGDAVADLDVSILQNTVLSPLLGIEDPRTDSRISFLGGIAGRDALAELAGENGVAFALYPTSVAEIMAISDAGEIMPPKSTWFEPKLISGLFIHEM